MTGPRRAVTDVTIAFGRQVHDLRKARGWTLREMGALVRVEPSTLSRIEKGVDTTIGTAGQIAGVLGVQLAALLRPVGCLHCLDAPPRGFTCQSCGATGTAVTG